MKLTSQKVDKETLNEYNEMAQEAAVFLNCKANELYLITEIGETEEIWEVDEIREEMISNGCVNSTINIIKEYQDYETDILNIGYVALCEICGIKMVLEQNSSPIGIWVSKEILKTLKAM